MAVMEAKEVKPLASAQVNDPRLGLLRAKPELGQQRPQRLEGMRVSRSESHITTRSSA